MQYKTFGKTGRKASILGFGAMRLPGSGERQVDYEQAVPILRRGIDAGITYIDSAHGYADGTSEIAVGKAIQGYDRSQLTIVTKIGVNEDASGSSWRERFDLSLKRLNVSYIDILLFHGLRWNPFSNAVCKPGAALEMARKAQAEGLIHHLGFSSHDSVEGITKLIDTGEFASMLVQYNYLDRHNEPVIDHAYANGMGVAVMGPVAGGRLAMPQGLIVDTEGQLEIKTPEVALRFVWNNPHVHVALSGMSSIEQVIDNTAAASIVGSLNDRESHLVLQLMEKQLKLADLYCTGCGYCMPCPNEINISENFRYMNWYKVWGMEKEAKEAYEKLSFEGFWAPWASGGKISGLKAEECLQCGECLPKCPQNIDIIQQLEETAAALGSKK